MRRTFLRIWSAFALFALAGSIQAFAVVSQPACPRYAPGSEVLEPANLYSSHGVLRVSLTYETRIGPDGVALFCFTTAAGQESPTLHVKPGDDLIIQLRNALPPSITSPQNRRVMRGMAMPEISISPAGEASGDLRLSRGRGVDPALASLPRTAQVQPAVTVTPVDYANCGGMAMTDTSVNVHLHGTNVPPTCHQDEVIRTLINSGETFEYDVHFPVDEPPGLYWYHPHIHGLSEAALQGGASGALIVDGLENINPAVAGLPVRTLVLRDRVVPADVTDGGDEPAWDVSVNYVPVSYPGYRPATLTMKPQQRQLWRVANASADTIFDLQVQYDGTAQRLHVVGVDGVPTGSMDANDAGKTVVSDHFLLGPAARVEFIVTGPALSVKNARLVTLAVETGEDGDFDPNRPLATIKASLRAPNPMVTMPRVTASAPAEMRFTGLRSAPATIHRTLYFSEVLSDPSDPNSPTNFYITVAGATPRLFSAANPPSIVTHRGSVEEWVVENRALESHVFHIHQIHFLPVAVNGQPVEDQYRDTIVIPAWSGSGPYPSVTLHMDFRGPIVGDFVYHCHILGHEDSGMMAIIRVLP